MNTQIHYQKNQTETNQKRTEIKCSSLKRIHSLSLDLHLITVKGARQPEPKRKCIFK